MPDRDNRTLPGDLAASLQRVVDGKQPETLYDTDGTPIAILVPVAEPGTQTAREQFLRQLRAWRDGDPEDQRREWAQLEEVLKDERLFEQPA